MDRRKSIACDGVRTESILPPFISMILSADSTVSGRWAMMSRVILSDWIALLTARSFETSRWLVGKR